MNCDECNDNGYTLVADQQHDVMMRVQCVPCLAHERMKHDLSVKMAKVIMGVPHVRLARIFSETLISLIDNENNPDYERLFALVTAKNKESLISLMAVMA